ncbi:MAG: GNAT family N-acetyltransferase [Actinomycetota bacterium]
MDRRQSQNPYQVRVMARAEVDFALELAAREGWNPGLDDAECFYQADPQGFLVGVLDGEPVGCISAVAYGTDFGFIGLYIVAPEHRGKGYGLQLWQAAMRRLAGRNIGLDGVVEQQANYGRSGFTLAHRNARYASRAETRGERAASVVPLAEVPFQELRAYDRRVFPAARDSFLRAWTGMPHSRCLGWLESGSLRGYGAIRACRQGHKIGPLFADAAGIAEALFNELCRDLPPGAEVYLDAPETNPEALALTERHGMEKVFETARMYTHAPPPLALERVFGITTFELG